MRRLLSIAALALLVASSVSAQKFTASPNGDNQKASVTQYIGPIRITIDYNSPKVHNPFTKEDRRGKIWGTLVPWGMAPGLGYGTCKECPWRGGANENTVFTTSHDIKVQGQPLPAGSYGLHLIPGETEWTVIFSKDSTSWGSFFYDKAHDQLRVKATPAKSEYHEWLTYEFPERDVDKATAALKWEELQVPISITVDSMPEVYFAENQKELRNFAGFDDQNYVAAAKNALQNKIHLKEALEWATLAAGPGFPGRENFNTLNTLADAQLANGLTSESEKTRQKAIAHPTASVFDLHAYGRQLLKDGRKQEALAVWQLNAKRNGDVWPVNVGLARGNSAVGNYKEALKYAKLAVAQAPDPVNKKGLEDGIKKLEAGKDMN
jgi:hypothetical protein